MLRMLVRTIFSFPYLSLLFFQFLCSCSFKLSLQFFYTEFISSMYILLTLVLLWLICYLFIHCLLLIYTLFVTYLYIICYLFIYCLLLIYILFVVCNSPVCVLVSYEWPLVRLAAGEYWDCSKHQITQCNAMQYNTIQRNTVLSHMSCNNASQHWIKQIE